MRLINKPHNDTGQEKQCVGDPDFVQKQLPTDSSNDKSNNIVQDNPTGHFFLCGSWIMQTKTL